MMEPTPRRGVSTDSPAAAAAAEPEPQEPTIVEHAIEIEGVRFRITSEHAASSYDEPVVIAPDGQPMGPADLYQLPNRVITGAEVMRRANPDLPAA